MYVLRLATEVNWDQEKECFASLSRETATFYSYIPQSLSEDEWKWTIEHVLYIALKQYLLPPTSFMSNKSFLQVASLSNLYKVFERC